jgi:anthranilate phosphoribosyltransferase
MVPDPKSLIKAVGRGKTLSRNLTMVEMEHAMALLLQGGFTQAQTGAFLQALRIKETTADEVAAALATAMRFLAVQDAPIGPYPLVVNVAYDSKRKPTVLSVMASRFLASAGLCSPCLVWSPCLNAGIGDPLATSLAFCQGVAGLEAEVPAWSVAELVPMWAGLDALRQELGFRSILNTLEKLLRPWREAPVVLGIAHDNFRTRLAEVLKRDGSASGAIVQGNHGTCDLGLGEEPTVVIRYGESVAETSISRKEFPWEATSSVHLIGSVENWPAWLADRESALWNAIRIQASFLLSVARPELDLAACVSLVRNVP